MGVSSFFFVARLGELKGRKINRVALDCYVYKYYSPSSSPHIILPMKILSLKFAAETAYALESDGYLWIIRFDNPHSQNSRLSSPSRVQMAAATKFIEYHWISVDSVTVKSKKFKCVNDLKSSHHGQGHGRLMKEGGGQGPARENQGSIG
ncbi:hypothetical protein FH972_004106 [Carpinus fangiana]|uniref:Uncharacterized protein n=1 Tax=Carpinus fangiana TaxID=176857 RepID=A0A5N6QMJ7_9ROSI|nr:hypothetical protein FH972_004106 [Carpinus fangiana]